MEVRILGPWRCCTRGLRWCWVAASSGLFLSVKTVEAHAATVFTKLGLHAAPRDNRRVLAVLTWLRSSTDTDNRAPRCSPGVVPAGGPLLRVFALLRG